MGRAQRGLCKDQFVLVETVQLCLSCNLGRKHQLTQYMYVTLRKYMYTLHKYINLFNRILLMPQSFLPSVLLRGPSKLKRLLRVEFSVFFRPSFANAFDQALDSANSGLGSNGPTQTGLLATLDPMVSCVFGVIAVECCKHLQAIFA